MPGQGSPHLRARIGAGSRWLALLGALALAWLPAATAGEIDARIRIAWGGGEPRPWQGTIQLSSGTLSDVLPLGLEPDAPGSMQITGEGTIRIQPRSPRSYDGCDLRVQGPENAKLIVTLWAAGAPPGGAVEVPLAKVLRGFAQYDLDERKNRLLAQRSPGDVLRVQFERPSLLFEPGERFDLEVQPNVPDLAPGTTYLLAAAVERARAGEESWNKDFEVRVDSSGHGAAVPLAIPLPTAEGVYEVKLQLYPKRLTSSLVRGKPLAARKVQLVVLAPVKTLDRQPAAWQSVLDFDPASPKWWERLAPRLPAWTRLPSPPHPIESGPARTRNHLKRTWVELPAGAWQAYPLSVSVPGSPHMLEVEYPSDMEQTLGISLIEPNAAGQVGPIGLDSGIDVAPPEPGHTPELRRHRLVCWPQSRTPYVLVVNRRSDRPALVGRINLLAGPRELPAESIPQPNFAARTLAAYYDKPLVAENFSASEAVDPVNRRHLDDWLTFYESGQRLVETLQYGGYNALVITVACEGSAIYPSRLLEPTPKYDTGTFFESGQDPIRKDVLELLMRLCDRSGIQLIPAVQFSGPLPALEAARLSGGPEAIGLEPVGPDGRNWLTRRNLQGGVGVYYNALDPRVQQAMRAVLDELTERYAHHPSFGGLAVQLSGEHFSLLPDETCSCDDVTFAQFLKDARLELPPALAGLPPLAAREKFLHESGEAAWLKWRTERLTAMYRQMHQELARQRPGARLYLPTADLLSSRQVQLALRPTLPPKADPAQLLPLMGLDVPALLAEGIVVPRPRRIVSAADPDARLLADHFNQWPVLDATFSRASRGSALITLEPAPLRLPQFDAVSPFGAENTRTLMLPEINPADANQRQRFVQSLAALDSPLLMHGGWLLPLGQEAALAPLVKVFRRLPAEAFATARPASAADRPQDLVVRTLAKDGKTFVYVLNTTPWPLSAKIEFSAAGGLRFSPYSDDRRADFKSDGGHATWTVVLQPWDLVGGELTEMGQSGKRVQVERWQVERPEGTVDAVRDQILEAQRRANSLRDPPPLAALQNPTFEAAGAAGAIPGWVFARGRDLRVEVDRTRGEASASSLHMVSDTAGGAAGPIVWVRSEAFPAPTTGRLSLIASIRTADPARQPTLRLAIEGRLGGQVYYMKANVGASEDGREVPPLSAEWSRYRFPLNSLPLAGLTDLRVGFDLMGTGEVWIDNVEVFDLYFEKSEREAMLTKGALASQSLAEQPADGCLFADSYWPGFLRRHVPLTDAPPVGPISSRPSKNSPAKPPAKPADRAAEKNKSWWPDWMRWR